MAWRLAEGFLRILYGGCRGAECNLLTCGNLPASGSGFHHDRHRVIPAGRMITPARCAGCPHRPETPARAPSGRVADSARSGLSRRPAARGAGSSGQPAGAVADVGASSHDADHKAALAEQAHSATDGEICDAVVFSQVALSRQLVAGRQFAAHDAPCDVISHLNVDKLWTRVVDLRVITHKISVRLP